MVLKAVQIMLTCSPLGTWQSICLSGAIYITSLNRVEKTSTMFILQFTLEEQIVVEDGMQVQVNQKQLEKTKKMFMLDSTYFLWFLINLSLISA